MARVLEKVAMYRFGPWYRPRIDESFVTALTKTRRRSEGVILVELSLCTVYIYIYIMYK